MVRTEMGEPAKASSAGAEIVAGSEHRSRHGGYARFLFRPHSMEWLAKHSVELTAGRIIAPEAIMPFSAPCPKIFRRWRHVRGSDSGGDGDCRRP